jgi:predicted nucleic acid-binding protein
MPDRVFVDTSFVLALINEHDQYHDQAEVLSVKSDHSLPRSHEVSTTSR